MRRSNYDKRPSVPVGPEASCHVGWSAITERLQGYCTQCCAPCFQGIQWVVSGCRLGLPLPT